MSDAGTATAKPLHPDLDRAVPARLDSAVVGNILRLLHTVVAYGRNLVQTLRQEDDPDDIPWYAFLTRIFGTTDPAEITVLAIRGLLRAAALQPRLRSLLLLPVRAWAATQTNAGARRPSRGPSPCWPRAAGWAIPPGWPAGDPSLDRLPTPEEEMFAEIVEEDRDRPIGPILLDICLDLGIVPDLMDPATWDELSVAITLHGGDPAPLVADPARSAGVERKPPDLFPRHSATGTPGPTDSPPSPVADQPTTTYPPWPAPYPQSPAPTCTGPP